MRPDLERIDGRIVTGANHICIIIFGLQLRRINITEVVFLTSADSFTARPQ